jgi:transposase InsO family protein
LTSCFYRPTKTLLRRLLESAQYASGAYRALLMMHGLKGSMNRRGNPYDNAKAESFMKMLKVETVYLVARETFKDVWRNRRPTVGAAGAGIKPCRILPRSASVQ